MGGIDRNSYDGSAHIQNLRLKDKAFRCVAVPETTGVGGLVDYIHTTSDSRRNLIGLATDSSHTTVHWLGEMGKNSQKQALCRFEGRIKEITHVGNTLILLASSGIHYVLFKNGKYIYLGDKIPDVSVRFRMRAATAGDFADDAQYTNRVMDSAYFHDSGESPVSGISDWHNVMVAWETSVDEAKSAITADFESQYGKAVSNIYSMGLLPDFPVQVRAAVRLFDGSYVCHSAPLVLSKGNGKDSVVYCANDFRDALGSAYMLKWATVFGKSWPLYGEYNSGEDGTPYINVQRWPYPITVRNPFDPMGDALAALTGAKNSKVFRQTHTSEKNLHDCRLAIRIRALSFSLNIPDREMLENWKDIITSIDIFVSKPMASLKTGELAGFPADDKTFILDAGFTTDNLIVKHGAHYNQRVPYRNLAQHTDREVRDWVASNGNFYLLRSVGVYNGEYKEDAYGNGEWVSLANDIKSSMAYIEQEKSLPDDYMSRHSLSADNAYVYNQSLHLAGITTTLFKGFAPDGFCVIDGESGYSDEGWCRYSFEGKGLDQCVAVSKEVYDKCFVSPMLFYPDPECVSVTLSVKRNGQMYIKTFPMKRHPLLYGSYYLDENLMPIDLSHIENVSVNERSATRTEHNKVISTPVGNPFMFSAERSNLVGNGSVLAMRTASRALSQGQVGQFPLYVFTTDGIYALSTDSEGGYASAVNVSNDILLAKGLVASATDSVIFGTAQGLKMLRGADTALLSRPLDGSAHRYGDSDMYRNPWLFEWMPDAIDFEKFMSADASVHYDYTHDEVWVFNKDYKYAYVLSLDSRAWTTRTHSADKMISLYPSLLLRETSYANGVTRYTLGDVTADAGNNLPFVIITNPVGGALFTRICDATIDSRFVTGNMECMILAGSNPFRMTKVRKVSVSESSPKPVPAIHCPRIPLSARYVQFAIRGTASEAMLTGITVNVETEPYNPTR